MPTPLSLRSQFCREFAELRLAVERFLLDARCDHKEPGAPADLASILLLQTLLGRFVHAKGWSAADVPFAACRPDLAERVAREVIVPAGLFARYRFAIDESQSLPAAIDPEILGTLVELSAAGRHSAGRYYSPRAVVTFMCRTGLKRLLRTRTAVAPATIDALVDRPAETLGREFALNAADASQVALALADVAVVDPACGAGAFLLGMLGELAAIWQTLPQSIGEFASEQPAERLVRIATRNLHGVDLDAAALEAARWRIWLAIAAAADEPPPWPAFNLVSGDALLGPNPEMQGEHATSAGLDWRRAFPAVFDRPEGGFDLVLGNPPYVRQELLDPSTKAALRTRYGVGDHAGVTGHSDLYCYFYVRGMQLLRVSGVQIFLCSNGWLDAGYGATLQRHLLDRAHLAAIYESDRQRHFTADVNTLISVLEKRPASDDEATAFVALQGPLEASLADPQSQRETRVTRRELQQSAGLNSATRANGDQPASHAGKWSGRFLRAADWLQRALERGAERLVPLGEVAEVRPGCYSGINDFFYLSLEAARNRGIEPECLRPLVRTTRDLRKPHLDAVATEHAVFYCPWSKAELAERGWHGALAYIEWGESQQTRRRQKTPAGVPWPQASTVARRALGWWAIPAGNVRPARNFLLYVVDRRYLAPWSDVPCVSDRCLHRLFAPPELVLPLAAVTNCSLMFLLVLLHGRGNLGQGAHKFEAADARRLPVFDPRRLPASVEWLPALESLGGREILPLAAELAAPDRRALDRIIFESLRFRRDEEQAVYDTLQELVERRVQRAASMTPQS